MEEVPTDDVGYVLYVQAPAAIGTENGEGDKPMTIGVPNKEDGLKASGVPGVGTGDVALFLRLAFTFLRPDGSIKPAVEKVLGF